MLKHCNSKEKNVSSQNEIQLNNVLKKRDKSRMQKNIISEIGCYEKVKISCSAYGTLFYNPCQNIIYIDYKKK